MFVGLSLGVLLAASQAAAPATGGIVGRVLAEGTNAPVVDARVMLIPAAPRSGSSGSSGSFGRFGPPSQSATDESGRFSFGGLAPGEYRLNVQKSGFVNYPGFGAGPGRAITVTAGHTADGVTIQLQRGGAIAGRLLDASGSPVPDARVIALQRAPVPPGSPMANRLTPAGTMTQQTNDLGEFRVSGLAAGEYFLAATRSPATMFGGPGVTATSRATAATTTYFPGTIDQAGAQPIPVTAGQTVNGIEFAMQSVPVFRIVGQVVDDNGPVANAFVMVLGDPQSGSIALGPIASAQTDASGGFVVGGVPSGTYRLQASIPARTSASGTVRGGSGAVVMWSSGVSAGPGDARSSMDRPTEVVVNGADATDVRVKIQKTQP